MKQSITYKHFLLLISILGLSSFLKAADFESLETALYRANNEDKIVLLEISSSENEASWKYSNSDFIKNKFINIKLNNNSPEYNSIKNKYKLLYSNCRLYLNKEGMLLLPIEYNYNTESLEKDCRQAACQQYEAYPLAQMDFDYASAKLTKNEIFEYILKRGRANLDNADLIDLFTTKSTKEELLTKTTLDLFFASNINLDGNFYSFVEDNKTEILSVLNWNNLVFENFVKNNFRYTFNRICEEKAEDRLMYIINKKKEACVNKSNYEIIEKKYLTEYYYLTKQPLKMANLANDYANSLVVSSISNKKDKEDFALKLRDVAQYVAETLSNKSILTKALNWTSVAGELFNSFASYETQAYLLYKLGKRTEAIYCMEKAHTMAPKGTSDYEDMSKRLIKMKRGEVLF